MTSIEKEGESASLDVGQEESNASVEAPSNNTTSKEENITEEKEDNSSNPGPSKAIDSKAPTTSNAPETKNVVGKINRGAKRMRLDTDASDKKGM